MRRIINKGCCIVFAFVLFVVFTSSQNGYVHAVNDAMQSGIMLDCARRYYSVEEIKKYIDILAEESNSFLQLHLSDNENVGVECRTLGQCADEDMYCEDGSYINTYTKKRFLSYEQIQELLLYANEKEVELIPEIDMPGHMNGFFQLAKQKYGYDYYQTVTVNQNEVCGELNITVEDGRQLADDLLCEYAKLFQSCKYFHMGFDEYWTDYGERLVDFMNQQAHYLQSQGFVVRIWNDLINHENSSKINHDIEIVFWSHDGATLDMEVRKQRIAERLSVPELQEEGFRLIITNSYYLYFVPSDRSCTKEALDYTVNDIINNWELSRWDANYEGGLISYNNIQAAMIAVWGEEAEEIDDDTICTQTYKMYHAMLRKLPDTEQVTTEEIVTTVETATTEENTTAEGTVTTEEKTTAEVINYGNMVIKKKKTEKRIVLKIKKLGSKKIKLYWKKQDGCNKYKIYRYDTKTHSYRFLKKTKHNEVVISNWTKQRMSRIRLNAYCSGSKKTVVVYTLKL